MNYVNIQNLDVVHVGDFSESVPNCINISTKLYTLKPLLLNFDLQEVASKPFSEQAVAFLNAYWPEVHTEAEFIYSVAWETIKYADMHAKGISLVFKYEEGLDLDFNIGLYFYERLCKFVEDPKNFEWGSGSAYAKSQPEMMTAIKRKQELRDKVDVNFDGRISMLEYLLYQYRDVANPADFCVRSMAGPEEHPEITKARKALDEVNNAIRAYETEKARLSELAAKGGVKGMTAKNELAQIDAGPLAETLNYNLIRAEAAVRKAVKLFGPGGLGHSKAGGASDGPAALTDGAIWWMQRELARPLFLVAMVMIASAFTMRHSRFGRTGLAVLTSIMMGFGLYYIRNFAQILGENGQIAISLAAWTPPVASVMLALGLLLHMEDG